MVELDFYFAIWTVACFLSCAILSFDFLFGGGYHFIRAGLLPTTPDWVSFIKLQNIT
jgi:hypothetical protein